MDFVTNFYVIMLLIQNVNVVETRNLEYKMVAYKRAGVKLLVKMWSRWRALLFGDFKFFFRNGVCYNYFI